MENIMIAAMENLGYAIGLIIVFVLYFIARFFGKILGKKFEMTELREIAWTAVNLAEDKFIGDGKGEKRRTEAVEWAHAEAKRLGIVLDKERMEAIVRGIYNASLEEITKAREKREKKAAEP